MSSAAVAESKWLRSGQQVDDRAYRGEGGETVEVATVPVVTWMVVDTIVGIRQDSGVVSIARGGIRP
jgi:hypothetical protein